ncbi:MAG: NTP transferase domain-containing protein [Andreesenia angusta]|nr:NTP transferase domain-containing protein [Andreesenia angusta]
MASGMSRRFGSNKLMIKDINNKPLLENILERLSNYVFDQDEKILIYRDEEIKSLGDKYDFKTVLNNEYLQGKSASIKLGVNNSNLDSLGYMFFVGDQPMISYETIKAIRDRGVLKDKIIVPIYYENEIKKIGNPLYFPKRFAKDLLKLDKDDGGRTLIDYYEDEVIYLKIGSPIEFFDIDRKEDLNKFK